MKEIITELENFGLSNKQAKVYLAVLQLGDANVNSIAKKSGLNRTTVYPVLFQLIRSGFIKQTNKNKKQYFFIEDVNDLKKYYDQKERELKLFLPELHALHNILPKKPKITYYEGLGALRNFYLSILNNLEPGDTILEYLGSFNFEELMPKEFYYFYPEERVRKKIFIKTIAGKNMASKKLLADSRKFLREIKLVEPAEDNFSANIQIYKKGIGIISFTDDFMGVIIESQDIAKMMKSFFNLTWKQN